MADLHSNNLDVSPHQFFFLHFHAVFRKIWPNNRLATLTYPGSATAGNSGKTPLLLIRASIHCYMSRFRLLNNVRQSTRRVTLH